jgi:tetratricopeptide (TPR) repeat protein
MPPEPRRRTTRRPTPRPKPHPKTRGRPPAAVGIAAAGLALALAIAIAAGLSWWWWSGHRDRLAARALAAESARDWPAAARLWHLHNNTNGQSPGPDPASLRAEARAALAANRARQAETALTLACRDDPSHADAWRLRLRILRLEDRAVEARRVGAEALAAVPARSPSSASILREITLALLAQPPSDEARATLSAWVRADPSDLDALAALRRLMARDPRDGDPTRADRIAELEQTLAAAPGHVGVREALVLDLADAGRPDRGRALLDAWPDGPARDARLDRLRGRFDLDFDAAPARALEALDRALITLPHDWHTRYLRARALRQVGRVDDARAEADRVARLRELLDPPRLGPRLEASLQSPDDPRVALDLADLCAAAGLTDLAAAWRAQAQPPPPRLRPRAEPQDRFPPLDRQPQRAGQRQ